MTNRLSILQKFPFRAVQKLGIALIFVGLPFSHPMMSIGQMVLVGNWLLEGIVKRQLAQQFQRFFSDKVALALVGLFVWHLIGLLYSDNLAYGLRDIRIKLPLLVIPLVLSSSPLLNRKELEQLLGLFLLSLWTFSGYSSLLAWGAFGPVPDDLRALSPFISHIRLALMATLGFFIGGYFAFSARPGWLRAVGGLTMVWFLVFLTIIQVVSAALAWGITSLGLLVYLVWKQEKLLYRGLLVAVLLAIPSIAGFWIYRTIAQNFSVAPVVLEELDTHTEGGHTYGHYLEETQLENGNYVWLYIAWTELENGWKARSSVPFRGTDGQGNPVVGTLIRFLTSKDLRKDTQGVASLSDEEIQAIENGIANVRFFNNPNSLDNRMYSIVWELHSYFSGMNPEGNSITMRLEFWKTAWEIHQHSPWFGVGTGDVQEAFDAQYAASASQLSEAYRMRTHNQYLTILVTFGMVGLVFFMGTLLLPFFFRKYRLNYFFMVALSIALISMLSEDTLETQAGVTLVVFPFCFFLFGWDNRP